ncbi:MAG: hypothetical protein SFX72_20990 [Isosphaeraceae bacterium]|nr:hypothetical protein [Isosphaeraceae bacterium]
MELPQIRPGKVETAPEVGTRVLAFFFNSAPGNLAIQLLTAHGIKNDQLGVTTPDRIEGGQGMVLSIPCETDAMVQKVESLCRSLGAEVHRARRS